MITQLKQLENGMLSILTESLEASCNLLGANFFLVLETSDRSQRDVYGERKLGEALFGQDPHKVVTDGSLCLTRANCTNDAVITTASQIQMAELCENILKVESDKASECDNDHVQDSKTYTGHENGLIKMLSGNGSDTNRSEKLIDQWIALNVPHDLGNGNGNDGVSDSHGNTNSRELVDGNDTDNGKNNDNGQCDSHGKSDNHEWVDGKGYGSWCVLLDHIDDEILTFETDQPIENDQVNNSTAKSDDMITILHDTIQSVTRIAGDEEAQNKMYRANSSKSLDQKTQKQTRATDDNKKNKVLVEKRKRKPVQKKAAKKPQKTLGKRRAQCVTADSIICPNMDVVKDNPHCGENSVSIDCTEEHEASVEERPVKAETTFEVEKEKISKLPNATIADDPHSVFSDTLSAREMNHNDEKSKNESSKSVQNEEMWPSELMRKIPHDKNITGTEASLEEKIQNIDIILKQKKRKGGTYGYLCPIQGCYASFGTSAHKCRLHMKRCHEISSFPTMPGICFPCKKVYSDGKSLQNHLRIAHSSNVTCHICKKNIIIAGKTTLKGHINQVHKAKSIGDEKMCHVCGKHMKECHMKRHMKSHYKDTILWKCNEPLCFKEFQAEHLLIQHQKRYHPTFECPDCGLKFVFKIQMNQHKCIGKKSETMKEELKAKEDLTRMFSEGGECDMVEKVKEKLTNDQKQILDTFVLKTENVNEDQKNFKKLFSAMYYVGKFLGELEPKHLTAEQSKSYLEFNANRFLQTTGNGQFESSKRLVGEKDALPFKARLIRSINGGYNKKYSKGRIWIGAEKSRRKATL